MKPIVNKYLLFALVLLLIGVTAHAQDNEWQTLNDEAISLFREKQYNRALIVAEKALAVAERKKGPDHPDAAASLNTMAGIYCAQNEYSRAAPLVKRSLTIREKVYGADHPEAAKSMTTLAGIYLSQGNIVQVEPLLKRSLATSEKAFGPDHLDVARTLSGLADLYSFQNRSDKAGAFYTRSLAIEEKCLGADHPDLAAALNHVARAYRTHHMASEAEPLNRKALAIYMKAFDQDHPDVSFTLNELACAYYDQQRYSEAEPLFDRSLEIAEKIEGPNHPDVAVVLSNLAILYRATDREAMAKKLEKRAGKIRAVPVVPDAPVVRADITELQVKSFLKDWETAQSTGFYSDYETMYAKRFYGRHRSSTIPTEFDHDTWLKEKRDAFRWKMTVKVKTPKIRIANKTATVNFEETLDDGRDIRNGLKLLKIINENGTLKITREVMLFSRKVPEPNKVKDKPAIAASKKFGTGKLQTAKLPLTGLSTSLQLQDCSTNLPPPVAAFFNDRSRDALHCPGPMGWGLFLHNDGSFGISHDRAIWYPPGWELNCDFGEGSCVPGTERAEWRVTKSGEPKALIFPIYSQDKKQFERLMSPKGDIMSEHTAYQSRFLVFKFRNGSGTFCGTYAGTEQEARDIADNPAACSSILLKELLPKPKTGEAGKGQSKKGLTL